MPVKAGGGKARASSEAGGVPAWDATDTDAAPILPQPLRLKYGVGKIIGTFLNRFVNILYNKIDLPDKVHKTFHVVQRINPNCPHL